ncbi:MAG: autotransporter-associated beta strand repeat-containing protein [Pirellulales bacterium]
MYIADGASYNYSNNQYVCVAGLADYPSFSSLGTGRVYNSTNSDQGRVVQLAGSGNYTYGGTIVNGTSSGTIGLAISLTGSGTQTLTNATNSYTGPTDLRSGILSISSIKDGGTASNIGQSSNLATKLRFSGGTLKYTGAGDSTDRLFQVFAGGGAIDSSGTGALVFTNTGIEQSADTNAANGNATMGSNTVTLAGLNFFMFAVGQVVAPNTYFPSGGTITAINREKQTITLNTTAASTGTTVASFAVNSTTGTDRTFTLKGTNTDGNSIAAAMYDTNLGGKLGIAKSDAGKWTLSNTRYNSGPITVNGGTLEVGGIDVPAVTGVAATTAASSMMFQDPQHNRHGCRTTGQRW